MKYFNKIIYSIVLVYGLYGSSIKAQVLVPYLAQANYSTNIDYVNVEPIAILSNQVILDVFSSASATLTPAFITNIRNAQVDGYHQDTSGLQYYSFNNDVTVGGTNSVLKSDILKCNDIACSSYSLFFDADIQMLKDININAFTLDPINGDLIFSIENDSRINGSIYFASDLIRFDGADYSLEYDSTSDIFSRYKNIDALVFTSNNRYLVSFANESIFHEIYEYNLLTGVWATAYIPLSFSNANSPVNIESLVVRIQSVPDLIFQDSFE